MPHWNDDVFGREGEGREVSASDLHAAPRQRQRLQYARNGKALQSVLIRSQADADRLSVNRYDAIRTQQQSLQPDPSVVMRINDSPVIPALKPDTHIDPSVPSDPQTRSVTLPSVSPMPDLNNPPPPVPTK